MLNKTSGLYFLGDLFVDNFFWRTFLDKIYYTASSYQFSRNIWHLAKVQPKKNLVQLFCPLAQPNKNYSCFILGSRAIKLEYKIDFVIKSKQFFVILFQVIKNRIWWYMDILHQGRPHFLFDGHKNWIKNLVGTNKLQFVIYYHQSCFGQISN